MNSPANLQQRSAEWHEARIGRVTASMAGAALGVDPFTTPEQAIRRMVRAAKGAEPEFTGNVATEYGEEHEDQAFNWALFESGVNFQKVGFYEYDEWLGASPDGLSEDGVLLEIKCPYGARETGEFKKLKDLPHYYAQMQTQMLVCESQSCLFVQWSPKGARMEFVTRDDEYIEYELMPALYAFHQRYLDELENPAHLEDLEKDMAGDESWSALEERYIGLIEGKEALEKAIKEVKAELIERCDGAKARGDRVLVFPVTKQGSISYSKALKELAPEADLEPFRGKGSTTFNVRIL